MITNCTYLELAKVICSLYPRGIYVVLDAYADVDVDLVGGRPMGVKVLENVCTLTSVDDVVPCVDLSP